MRRVVLALLATLPLAAQELRWHLPPDTYAAYTIEGALGVNHLGFFGDDLVEGRRLRSEVAHPAFLSLPLVTRLPRGRVRKGLRELVDLVFSRLENFTPFRVRGVIRVKEAAGSLLFLEGRFLLLPVRVQGRDPRWYRIREGRLTFQSRWDLREGVLRSAAVRYTFTYEPRVALERLYTREGVRQRKVRVERPHVYRFAGRIPRKEMAARVDAWIDAVKEEMLAEWDGSPPLEAGPALGPGYVGLYTLALLHAGTAKTHPVIRKAMAYLRRTPPRSTYAASLILMALEGWYRPPEALRDPTVPVEHRPELSEEDRAVVARAVRYLVRAQQAGGWTYGDAADRRLLADRWGVPDHSNTQFALMGLYAARRLGARIDRKVWLRALNHYRRTLTRQGFQPRGRSSTLRGWGYRRSQDTPYGAMTAGAVASLAIVAYGLGVRPGSKSPEAERLGRLLDEGFRWLEYFYTVRQARRTRLPGPAGARDWAYHLYALERACDLTRTRRIGHHDWYHEGAMAILHDTYEAPRRDRVYHALCLLFLRRSTPPALTEPVR